jgi:hypothetical protein
MPDTCPSPSTPLRLRPQCGLVNRRASERCSMHEPARYRLRRCVTVIVKYPVAVPEVFVAVIVIG